MKINKTREDKDQGIQTQAAAHSRDEKGAPAIFKDNRPEADVQRKLQASLNPDPGMRSAPLQGRFEQGNHHNPAVIQRLIINTGDVSLDREFRKPTGWIVASDIYVALLRGGQDQDILELNQVGSRTVLSKNENIYLQGHGEPGLLGDTNPDTAARVINRFLPENYSGQIVSLSCSAGVGKRGTPSGVSGLAQGLDQKGVNVSGAAGVALNHSAYRDDKRVIPEDRYNRGVEKTIDEGIKAFGVNEAWSKYILTWNGDIKEAAQRADEISEKFYLDLQVKLEKMDSLMDIAHHTATATSPGKSSCYLTTACMQFKGLPDDCDELTTLRGFRDHYLRLLPGGDNLVDLYYHRAPFILAGINRSRNREEIYEELYQIIGFCVREIKTKKYGSALHTYKKMVEVLNAQYGNC